ncbi:MAG: DUF362 domain-containing protein [Bryobacterales bacterium]|nr:DUF362 domain-containing protein [Bryobacterales bacterium]
MPNPITRRDILRRTGAAALALARPAVSRAASAPTAPVAVTRCRTYSPAELVPALQETFDRIGGLGRMVKGKTVAIKLNFNGGPTVRLGHHTLGDSHWPHPNLVCAAMQLMTNAGARRIRLLECAGRDPNEPFEEHFLAANWNPADFARCGPRVEFENTNFMGRPKKFVRFPVPGGGLLYPAYDLNHSYADCDVFVTIAKYKDHPTTGVTLVMKNLFGMTPTLVYGERAREHEKQGSVPGSRMEMMHYGQGEPAYGAPGELDPASPRDDGYRLPRIIADLCAARPVHLSIVDGIKTMAGAQTPDPWCTLVNPGVLMAGTNVVTTAAVAVAAMNYDPRATRGAVPFAECDNKLLLAEQIGVGTCDLSRIEVIGPSVRQVMFDFRDLREKRRAELKRLFPKRHKYGAFRNEA